MFVTHEVESKQHFYQILLKLFFPLPISPQIIIYLYILCYLEMQRERTNASASNSLRIISANTDGFSLSKERLM